MLFHNSHNVFRLERKVCTECQGLRGRVVAIVHTDARRTADSFRIHTPVGSDAEEVVERNIDAQARNGDLLRKGRRQRVTQLDLLDLEIGTALEPHARVSGSGIADRIGMRV